MTITLRVPNFFLAGAPKCGTTALSNFLAGYPGAFMSESAGIKEPNFFNDDLSLSHIPERIKTRGQYETLFTGAPSTARVIGEASSLYLYSTKALRRIRGEYPEAKVVVMVRNPVEIARALHNQHLKHGAEVASFERAWRLQGQRQAGHDLPPTFKEGEVLQYGAVARIGEQLRRLLDTFPASQVHVLAIEDFANPRNEALGRLLAWLGLPMQDDADLPRLNSRRHLRSERLHAALSWIRRGRERVGIPGGWGIGAALERFNWSGIERPLPAAFHDELTRYFRTDISLLSDLTGRDFRQWLT